MRQDPTPDREKNGPPFIDRPRSGQQDYNSRTGVTFYFRLPDVFFPRPDNVICPKRTPGEREDSSFWVLFPRTSRQKQRLLLYFAVQSLPLNANRRQHRREMPAFGPPNCLEDGLEEMIRQFHRG